MVDEDQLIREYSHKSISVPEGIFRDPTTGKVITLEVKRIVANTLPMDDGKMERRKVMERGKIVWPWKKTVQSAMRKAHPNILRDHGAMEHHAVFLVPSSLKKGERDKLMRRTLSHAAEAAEKVPVSTRIHFLLAPDSCFDRF